MITELLSVHWELLMLATTGQNFDTYIKQKQLTTTFCKHCLWNNITQYYVILIPQVTLNKFFLSFFFFYYPFCGKGLAMAIVQPLILARLLP
jgi:hypothetical protein